MNSLFNTNDANDIKQRINNLQPNNQRLWGKMDAAQMMWHCKEALGVATGDTSIKVPILLKLFAPLIKKKVVSATPYKSGLPTAKEFINPSNKNFEDERKNLLIMMDKFIAAEKLLDNKKHPAFGKMTKEEWGYSQWKHLDHHLRQFGA